MSDTVYGRLTDLADAIREKTGGTERLSLSAMAEAVGGIESAVEVVSGVAEGTVRSVRLWGLSELRNYAFYGCGELCEVALPDTLTRIGSNCFYGCASLSSLDLPKSLEQIGTRAFFGTSSLTRIVIPSGVTSIPAACFQNCAGLATVILEGDTVKTLAAQSAFIGTPVYDDMENFPIYIKTEGRAAAELISEYAEATNWVDQFTFAEWTEGV